MSIREALATPELQAEVRAVLGETKQLLMEKFGFTDEEQQAYIEKTLKRISNPDLPDTCERVGRGPLRKLSRHERFIGPAAELVERGHTAWDLLNAVGAALRFDVPADDDVHLGEGNQGVGRINFGKDVGFRSAQPAVCGHTNHLKTDDSVPFRPFQKLPDGLLFRPYPSRQRFADNHGILRIAGSDVGRRRSMGGDSSVERDA